MRKVTVIVVLVLAFAVLTTACWRVATGKGFWPDKARPVTEETKQPQSSLTEAEPPEAVKPQAEQPVAERPVAREPVPEKPETKPTADSTDSMPQIPPTALERAEKDPNIVALIADYVITRKDVEEQLLRELRPYDYGDPSADSEPATAQKVLRKLVADKAVTLEGRENDLLENDMIYNAVKRFRERQYINLLMQKEIPPRLTVTDDEIQEKMKADPKLDRAKAEQAVKAEKGKVIAARYYDELYKKSNIKKATATFPKVAEVHQRLLLKPIAERKVNFIRNHQIKNELTDAEKTMILATFDGGKVTLEDWFMTIGEIAPPYRPRDLHTAQGVDNLLERALKSPLLVAEALRQGVDKDQAVRKQIREYEDRNILGLSRQNKGKEVVEPNEQEIKAYYEQNKDSFVERRKLKVDQIWCSNRESAQKVRAELNEGKDFDSLKQQYSIDKESKVMDLYPQGEAYFWPDLWKAEPNDVVGPVKGMRGNDFNWRLVRIIEKQPGTIPEFSEQTAERVKRTIMNRRRVELMDKYDEQLLKKYPHKIYADRVKDIDPLDIP